MKLLPLRNSIKSDCRRSVKICERMNEFAFNLLNNEDVKITNLNNDCDKHSDESLYSADIFFCDSQYEIHPDSDLFENDCLLKFKCKYICVKVLLHGHYVCILIDNHKKLFQLFDPSGMDTYYSKDMLALMKSVFDYYPLHFVQTMSLQLHDEDCFCQTWIYVWFHYRINKQYTHAQFKRRFQNNDKVQMFQYIKNIHVNILNK